MPWTLMLSDGRTLTIPKPMPWSARASWLWKSERHKIGRDERQDEVRYRERSGTVTVLKDQQAVLSYDSCVSLTSAPAASLSVLLFMIGLVPAKERQKEFFEPNNSG